MKSQTLVIVESPTKVPKDAKSPILSSFADPRPATLVGVGTKTQI